MRLVDARPVGAVKADMTRDELPPMVDLDRLPVGLHFDLPPRKTERHRVAVGLEGDQAVLGDVPDGAFLDDVARTPLRVEEKSFFLGEHLRRLPVRRAVDPLIGHGHDPPQKTDVEMIETLEALSPEEALDVFYARLDLALGLGPVGPMRPRLEAVMAAEVPEDRVPLEAGAREVPAQDDRLQVVIDDLVRHTAQVSEGSLVASKEGRELLVRRGLGVEPPAVAQRQDEKMDLDALARDRRPTLAPVGLSLAPRRRLEPHRGLLECLCPQRADEPLDRFIASRIAPRLELLIDGPGTVADGRQPLEDVALMRGQDPPAVLPPLIRLRRRLTEDLANRLDMEPQSPSDRLLRLLKPSPAMDLVPHVRLDHVPSSQSDCREETYSLESHLCTPFRSGGDFSMPIEGDYCMPVDN